MKIKGLLIISFLSLSLQAFGGAETGHGGGGVVCTSSENNSEDVQTLDLWQGTQHGLTIIRTNDETVEVQIDRALVKIASAVNSKATLMGMRTFLKRSRKAAKFVNREKFNLPKDLDLPGLPENCRPVGIGLYHDGFFFFTKDRLKINKRVYDKLSDTDKAAFWVHEAEYAMMRQWGFDLKSSIAVQRIVAIAFSQENFLTAKWPADPSVHK